MENKTTGRHVSSNHVGQNKKHIAFRFVFMDLIMVGVILCTFAFFHHVLDRWFLADTYVPVPSAIVKPEPVTAPATEPASEEGQPTQEEVEIPVVDTRTEWQKKFADHFTDEIISTENSYSSPDVSITISTYSQTEVKPCLTYYVADIYIAQVENFQTYFATGEYAYCADEPALDMDAASNALLSINGDYCNNQRSGLLVRNGELYLTEQTNADICVLYYDGSMETFEAGTYDVDSILEKSPYQIWKFGPELLDGSGQPKTRFNTSDTIRKNHPRTGFGYYEPGHYCFVVVDGRQYSHSMGLNIEDFAQLFADLGCTCAYNLDGGDSSIMTFNDEVFSVPSGYSWGRELGDILLIKELDEASEAEP